MKINRNNYELYFIDYLDGNLSDRDILMLEDFLLINPDLREELEGAEKIHLQPENLDYGTKTLLKKPDINLPITESNFEDFCVAESEGDLNTNERKSLSEYISEHPDKKLVLSFISKLHLSPDLKVIFARKEKLKKGFTLLPREYVMPILSVAATIAIVVLIYSSNKEFFRPIHGLTAEFPTEFKENKNIVAIPDSAIVPSKIETQNNRVEKQVQNASILAISTTKQKKQSGTVKKGVSPVKKSNENKNTSQPQRLNPSFHIKLASITDGEIPAPTIERGKIIYSTPTSKNQQNTPEYLSLSEYASKQFTEKILGAKDINTTHLSGWQIADAGISGINKLTGGKMKLDKKTDEEGNVTSYSFNSKLLSFSTTNSK